MCSSIPKKSSVVFGMPLFFCWYWVFQGEGDYTPCSSNILLQFQVIASGDFKQLPPVPNYRYSDTGEYCFSSEAFSTMFPHHFNFKMVNFKKLNSHTFPKF